VVVCARNAANGGGSVLKERVQSNRFFFAKKIDLDQNNKFFWKK
jgi:hypothetical protein